MRTVLLVTRHQDIAALAPALNHGGFSTTTLSPAAAYREDGLPRADAAVLDLRDVSHGDRPAILEALEAGGLLTLAVVEEQALDQIAADAPFEDFVVLPTSAAELTRRLERALWRKHGVDTENRVAMGALTIDLSTYRVAVDDDPVVLTFKEYELLRFLALNPGRVFTREQLLSRVWGYDYFGGARTVDVHVRRIRSKIEIHGHTFIETVRNVGYRLVADARKRPTET